MALALGDTDSTVVFASPTSKEVGQGWRSPSAYAAQNPLDNAQRFERFLLLGLDEDQEQHVLLVAFAVMGIAVKVGHEEGRHLIARLDVPQGLGRLRG